MGQTPSPSQSSETNDNDPTQEVTATAAANDEQIVDQQQAPPSDEVDDADSTSPKKKNKKKKNSKKEAAVLPFQLDVGENDVVVASAEPNFNNDISTADATVAAFEDIADSNKNITDVETPTTKTTTEVADEAKADDQINPQQDPGKYGKQKVDQLFFFC